MSDANPTLEILLKYIRDETQANAALTDLEAMKTSTRGVGESAHGAGEGLKFFNTHGREMHKLIHTIDNILPGTGLLLRAAFHPSTLGIAATIFAIHEIKHALDEYNKKLDEIGEAAAKASFAEGIQAALEATREAVAEQETFLHNLEEIKRGEHGVAMEMAHQLQLLTAIEAAKKQQAAAEKALALAKVKEDEIFGRITESDAIIRKGEIEKKYIHDKRAAENAAFAEQQAERMKALDEAAKHQTALEQEAASKAAGYATQKAEKEKAIKSKPEADDLKKAREDADKADEAYQSKKAGQDRLEWAHKHLGMGTDADVEASRRNTEQMKADADAAKAKADGLNKLNQAAIDAQKIDLTPAKLSADDAKKEAEENAKALAKARDDFRNEQEKHNRTAGASGATDSAEESTTDSTMRAELFKHALDLKNKFETGSQGLTRQEAMELIQLLKVFGEAMTQMGDDKVTKTQLQKEMDALKRLIEKKK